MKMDAIGFARLWDQSSKRAKFGLIRGYCVLRLFLVIWTCQTPLFAVADDCTDAFKSMGGLVAGISVGIECSTERQTVYKGAIHNCVWARSYGCSDVLD